MRKERQLPSTPQAKHHKRSQPHEQRKNDFHPHETRGARQPQLRLRRAEELSCAQEIRHQRLKQQGERDSDDDDAVARADSPKCHQQDGC